MPARSDNCHEYRGRGQAITNEKDSVSTYFVAAAVARLAPAARDRVLAAAGIPPELALIGRARVPAPAYSALWLAVARELDDEFFGLDSRAMKVGSFALLSQAVLGCPTLDRAVRRMLRGFSVLLDDVGGKLSLSADASTAEIIITNRIADSSDRRFADETFLVLVHGLMCWLIGRRLALQQVDFAFPRPPHAGEYTQMFCQHVAFDAPRTAIRFDAAALSAPVVQDAASLKRFLATAPQSVFLKYRNEDSWTARVRRCLRAAVERDRGWPVFAAVAGALGTAETTLRRRLDAEGSSYQGIKDQLRSDLAVEQLCQGDASVEAIAALLGFQDVSAFHRAFRRWNGVSPGEFRRRQRLATVARRA
ncbi:AraC family transcriptional regulator [Piscinibacter sakaiensis]|uniref:AraC family transcriptional regulator n=1 Tax=Piscinibacter sakaiensis TaxID=1547922 RepID=UPI003AAD8345